MKRPFYGLPGFWAALAAIAAAACAVFGGPTGIQGYLLGLGGTLISLGALWLMIRVLGKTFANEKLTSWGTVVVVVVFLMKLPIIVAAIKLAQYLGGSAPGCFLAGLGLVYSALVGWVLADSLAHP